MLLLRRDYGNVSRLDLRGDVAVVSALARVRDANDGYPKYAWPGGYPVVYVCADGGTLCAECANGKNGSEAHTKKGTPPDWRLVGYDIHYEGAPETCDHCSAVIESAYGEVEDGD